MPKNAKPQTNDATFNKILLIERRIHAIKGDIENLFENYLSDLILLRELRLTLGVEMVTDIFPPSRSDKTPNTGDK